MNLREANSLITNVSRNSSATIRMPFAGTHATTTPRTIGDRPRGIVSNEVPFQSGLMTTSNLDDEEEDDIEELDPNEAREIFAAAALRPAKRQRLENGSASMATVQCWANTPTKSDLQSSRASTLNVRKSEVGTSESANNGHNVNTPIPTLVSNTTAPLFSRNTPATFRKVAFHRLNHHKHDHPFPHPERCLALQIPRGRGRAEVKTGDLYRWASNFGKVGHVCLPNAWLGFIYFAEEKSALGAYTFPQFAGTLTGALCFLVGDDDVEISPELLGFVQSPTLEVKSVLPFPVPPPSSGIESTTKYRQYSAPRVNAINVISSQPTNSNPSLRQNTEEFTSHLASIPIAQPVTPIFMSSEIFKELIPPPALPRKKKRKRGEEIGTRVTVGDFRPLEGRPDQLNLPDKPISPMVRLSNNSTSTSTPGCTPVNATWIRPTLNKPVDSTLVQSTYPIVADVPRRQLVASSSSSSSANLLPNSGSLFHRAAPSSPRSVIDLTLSSPETPLRTLPKKNNKSTEINSSGSEVSEVFDSEDSGFTSVSSVLSEEVMKSADSFIRNVIQGSQPSLGVLAGVETLEVRRVQLEERIRLAKEELLRKKASVSKCATNSPSVVSRTGMDNTSDKSGSTQTNVVSLGTSGLNAVDPSSSTGEAIPPLPITVSREALLEAQFARMTTLMQELKVATTVEEKRRISRLIRACETEYQSRSLSFPDSSPPTASTSRTHLWPSSSSVFIWPFHMQTEICLTDDED